MTVSLLRGLRAWGAVEKNARWLHRIKNLTLFGQPLGFGLLDLALAHLQHVDPGRLQAAACSVRWINSLTALLLPGHISRYVQERCSSTDISGHVAAYIYMMTKITATIPLTIMLTLTVITLIISGDRKQLSYLKLGVSWTLALKYDQSDEKLLAKSVFLIIPGISIIIIIGWYFVLRSETILTTDANVCFIITVILWICMTLPAFLFITLYRFVRLISVSEDSPRELKS